MDTGNAGPLRRDRAQRVAAMQVVGAVRRHDHDLGVEGAGEQERQQVARGPVGPVDVLDHDQQRPLLAELLQRGVQRLEEVGAVQGVGWVGATPGARQRAAAGLQV